MIKWEQSWQTIGAVPMWCFLHSIKFTWNKANAFHMVFIIAKGTKYLLCMGKYMSVANGTIIHLYPIENLSLPCDKPWCRTGIYKNIPSETLLEISHIHVNIDSGVNKPSVGESVYTTLIKIGYCNTNIKGIATNCNHIVWSMITWYYMTS